MLILKKLGFNLKKIEDDGEEISSINLEGIALDEIDLIEQSIQTLIKQLELTDMFNDDFERFDNEMKKIILAVANNYRNLGLLERFTQQIESLFPIKEF